MKQQLLLPLLLAYNTTITTHKEKKNNLNWLYYTLIGQDRDQYHIYLSGKVILGEAKPSPNITLPDQINMILGEVLPNKCFIIPATLCAPGPSHALLIQTKRPFTRHQCAPPQVCVLRHLFSNVEFYCVRTGYVVMESNQFCLKLDERVKVKWQ